MKKNVLISAACVTAAIAGFTPAYAQEGGEAPANPIKIEALYKADAMAVVSGGLDRDARLLGNGEFIAEADLDQLVGWTGARAMIHVLSVHGGTPNDLAGTIQGVNNIEVANDRTKLYEIWVEQSFANDRAALLVGMADLNADFYQNDAAGLLIAPAFGIGSEIASTGPNGPSIFPSTALAARLRVSPSESSYLHLGIFNAKAGVLGDRGGVDFDMRDGALAIGEAGILANGKLAVGYWRYTERQPDIRTLDAAGNPVARIANGIYFLGEQGLFGSEESDRQLSAFMRVGLSDGDTSPFRGGWQAGLLLRGALAGRPESQLSFGVNQAYLSKKFRRNALDEGAPLGRAETGFELTYSDQLLPFLAVQPDLQYIRNPSADPTIKDAVVAGVRFTLAWARD